MPDLSRQNQSGQRQDLREKTAPPDTIVGKSGFRAATHLWMSSLYLARGRTKAGEEGGETPARSEVSCQSVGDDRVS